MVQAHYRVVVHFALQPPSNPNPDSTLLKVIVKLAMLSETALFGDILPEYRIRLPTEKEREIKVQSA